MDDLNKIKGYYINLNIASERRKSFKNQCKNTNIFFERYSAINGAKVTYKKLQEQELLTNINYNILDYTIGGRIAVMASHLSVWKKFIECDHNYNYLLVNEDDSIIPKTFDKELIDLLKDAPKDWNFIYLFYNIKLQGKTVNSKFIKPDSIIETGINTGFVSYIIKRDTVRKMLDLILPIDYKIISNGGIYLKNIDHFIKKYYNFFSFYFSKNKLILHHNSFPSYRRKIKSTNKFYS